MIGVYKHQTRRKVGRPIVVAITADQDVAELLVNQGAADFWYRCPEETCFTAFPPEGFIDDQGELIPHDDRYLIVNAVDLHVDFHGE